jgi:hypothetical protein
MAGEAIPTHPRPEGRNMEGQSGGHFISRQLFSCKNQSKRETKGYPLSLSINNIGLLTGLSDSLR